MHPTTLDSGLSEQQRLDPPAAPPANDDLTIAEHLRAWKQACTEGEETYRNEAGDFIRVPEHIATRFVREHGALHPGDYRDRYKHDWREDFASLQSTT